MPFLFLLISFIIQKVLRLNICPPSVSFQQYSILGYTGVCSLDFGIFTFCHSAHSAKEVLLYIPFSQDPQYPSFLFLFLD